MPTKISLFIIYLPFNFYILGKFDIKKVAGINDRAVYVAAGENFSIVCNEKGEVYTWGEGAGGRLGTNDQKDSIIPSLVSGIIIITIIYIVFI